MRDYQFGEFIYKLRSEHGLSQSKLGALVDVSNKAVSKWENGVSKPSMDTLKALAVIFHVSVEELLAGRRFSESGSDEPITAAPPAAQTPMPEQTPTPKKSPAAKNRKGTALMILSLFLAGILAFSLLFVSVYHLYKFKLRREDPPSTETEESEKKPSLEDVKNSVVKIETNLGTGSGFCAIKGNWVITNYHVIQNSSKIYIIDDGGRKSEIRGIVFYDEEKDIAVLNVKERFTPIALGNGNRLALQDDITVIGSPQGVLNTVSVGIVSNVSHEEYIVISAPISPGSSGGVLLNEKQQAVGIITAMAKGEYAQNLNFAINIEKLKEAYTDYKNGAYLTPSYPLNPNSGSSTGGSSGGGNSGGSTPTKEIPQYLIKSKPEYIATEQLFRIQLSVGSNYGRSIAANMEIGFLIVNANGETVYDKTHFVKASDFVSDSLSTSLNQAVLELPASQITEGSIATGSFTVRLLYMGNEIDCATWDVERGLPVQYTPFETLHYSGTGVGSIAGVDFPYGTYNIIFTHEGGTFEVELNGHSICRLIGNNKTLYVYQLKPDEDSHYDGTPLKNAVFNIVSASGPWTVTIERANTTDVGRTYVDGVIYSGTGIGYVKDIYLPYGTYNITITHSGSSIFDIELNGISILRKIGQISYVYTLKPNEEMHYAGTPLPSAYFNIVEADGDWSITIHRVD